MSMLRVCLYWVENRKVKSCRCSGSGYNGSRILPWQAGDTHGYTLTAWLLVCYQDLSDYKYEKMVVKSLDILNKMYSSQHDMFRLANKAQVRNRYQFRVLRTMSDLEQKLVPSYVSKQDTSVAEYAWNGNIYHWVASLLRTYIWWSLCTLCLLAYQVRVNVNDSVLRCCVLYYSDVSRALLLPFVDSRSEIVLYKQQ